MAGRASRARKLASSFLVLATALACGSSHRGGDEDSDDPAEGGSGGRPVGVGGYVGTSGFGTNPPPPGAGGAGAATSTGGAPTTGGVGTAGSFGVAGAGGFAIGGGAGFGATGGGPTTGGAAGAPSYPPGACPVQPPPNGTSCAAYHADPNFHCYYDAPACRVVSTCLTDDKWRSGCDAPVGGGGEGGAAPGDAGAGGA